MGPPGAVGDAWRHRRCSAEQIRPAGQSPIEGVDGSDGSQTKSTAVAVFGSHGEGVDGSDGSQTKSTAVAVLGSHGGPCAHDPPGLKTAIESDRQ